MDHTRISVCVPCYERPQMLAQLIESFCKQSYPYKELIVVDDSLSDAVQTTVARYVGLNIVYHKNLENLGYARNFRKSIECATGAVVLMLGDDDALLSEHALARYVEVFDGHPEVGYVYSNQVQFNNQLRVEYLVRPFEVDALLAAGDEAFERIWTTAIFIPGMALRNVPGLLTYYPTEHMLFPQLELVGHIIAQHDAYGIADLLIAGRAHEQQLGFYAIRGERIKGAERHGTVELREIFTGLAARYPLTLGTEFLTRDLVARFAVTLFKERLVVGKRLMRENYRNFCAGTPAAASSTRLRAAFLLASWLPPAVIRVARLAAVATVRLSKRADFAAAQRQLRVSVHAG